jgi:hypothetical protein
MIDRVSAVAVWHVETALRVLRATSPWVVLVPVAGALGIYLLHTFPAIVPYLDKPHAEFISPIILAAGLVIAVGFASWRPEVYFDWLALFALALFLRELHFRGTNTGFYAALFALIWWASYAREHMEPFISARPIATLLMAVLWTYFVSKTFDRHLWDAEMVGGMSRDLFEENLEVLGHVLFVALVIVSAIFAGPIAQRSRERGRESASGKSLPRT